MRVCVCRDDKTAGMCNSTADLQAMVEQQAAKQSGEDLFEEVSAEQNGGVLQFTVWQFGP